MSRVKASLKKTQKVKARKTVIVFQEYLDFLEDALVILREAEYGVDASTFDAIEELFEREPNFKDEATGRFEFETVAVKDLH